jgi:CubicO group peptidase (beta-lactamase class C family)
MHTHTRSFRLAILLFLASVATARAQGVNTIPPALATRVEAAVHEVMQRTQVPSVSLGIVQDGRIVYTAAFGHARLSPPLAATPGMHYAIGSISKQFTTACILLLVQEGKLSLDDPVSRFFPELTRASEVTIRNLLTHTSGYEDYAPQDYTIPAWTHPTTAQAIVHEWATKPLDFDPGTQYQYSNTNFNILGLIVEKASGEPFWQFLSSRVLEPPHPQPRHRPRQSRGHRLRPERAGTTAAGADRGTGLVLRRWRDGDAGGRPAHLGHFADEPESPLRVVV